MSPRQAELKKTSEQRCEEAFRRFFATEIGTFREASMIDGAMRQGWIWCWRHLE